MKAKKRKKGFAYTVTPELLAEYRNWPVERRLRWLWEANRLRRLLPRKTIEIQEAFRQGKL
ncbi:MAG: hypothetical protein PHE84_12895 [bacterium]|nr:hypothetical protein [bacterium]